MHGVVFERGGVLRGSITLHAAGKLFCSVYARKTQAWRPLHSIGRHAERSGEDKTIAHVHIKKICSLEVFSLTFSIVQRFLYNPEVTVFNFSFTFVVSFRVLVTAA